MSITPLPPVKFTVSEEMDLLKSIPSYPKATSIGSHFLYDQLRSRIFPAAVSYNFPRTKANCDVNRALLFERHMYHEMLRFDHNREEFLKRENAEQATLQTADRVAIDTLTLYNSFQSQFKPKEKKWVVLLHGNSNCYESHLHFIKKFSEDLGANILTGNYRGIMRSEGEVTCAKDWLYDAEAMVQHLIHTKNADPKNITVFGWSLGAGIGTKIASLHQEPGQEMSLINDRSFYSITKIVEHFAGNYFKKLIDTKRWDLGVEDAFKKIRAKKIVLFSKEDGVIPYHQSLTKAFGLDKNAIEIVLNRRTELSDKQWGEENHCKPLWETGDAYREFHKQVMEIFWGSNQGQ